MVTLKDFLELDDCICGLDIDLRNPTKLVESHMIGLGAYAGAHCDYIGEVGDHIVMFDTHGTKRFIHNVAVNFHQTDKPFKGPCRPYGIEWDAIPKEFLKLKVRLVKPWAVGFNSKRRNGSYYSLWLEVPDGFNFLSTMQQPEEETNITFDDILEVEA